MTKWFQNLNTTWQSLVVIGAVFAFALAVAAFAYPISQLPAQVEANRDDISHLRFDMQKIEIRQEDILEAIRLSNCLALAEAKRQPWQECTQ